MVIKGSTKVVALFAHPAAHSPEPELVNAAFEALGAPQVMVPFDVRPERLVDALKSVRPLGLAGLSISRPHKEAVCGLLDSQGPTSTETCAVDTISIAGTQLVGHNTDLWGFLKAMEEAGTSVMGKRAVIVGAGGTARSIAAALVREGAASVTLLNRTAKKAEALAAALNGKTGTVPYSAADLRRTLPDADLLINATPAGLDSLLSEKDLHAGLTVFDATFAQATPLLMAAKHAGAAAVSGNRMLFWKAVFAAKEWTGQEVPVEKMEALLSSKRAPALGSVPR